VNRLKLVLHGRYSALLGSRIAEVLREAFPDLEVGEPLFVDTLPAHFYNMFREQLRAEAIARYLGEKYGGENIVLGITDMDGYVPGLNFVFGIAMPTIAAAVVFLHRLATPNTDLFESRVIKEALHELGHLFGLRHCSNPRCVMRFSNTVMEVDYKQDAFCRRCAEKLELRGIKVSQEYVLF